MAGLFGYSVLASIYLLFNLCVNTVGAAGPNILLPSYPLAVKSPYLSTWVPGNQLENAAQAQPEFWNGVNLTWPVLARVNGKVYSLFGSPSSLGSSTAATTEAVSFTSSHTYITLAAGGATFILDFFSPVLPSKADYQQQSLPYSYLTVNATASSASIQILSGIDYTWTAQNGASVPTYLTAANTGYFSFYNPGDTVYTENNQQAAYGTFIYGSTTGENLTHGCDTPGNVYTSWATTGALTPSSPCAGKALAALSKNLGTVGNSGASVTFTVGFDRTKAINYTGQDQTGAYHQTWPTVPDAVEYVLNDGLPSALAVSYDLDSQIAQRAQSLSSVWGDQYATILEASVRQTFGAFELTVPESNVNADPWVFLKEISSDGNVNTVDLIYQSWPIFICLNPEYIKLLFEPILAYLQTGAWPHPWVIHDLGSHYPVASGHSNGQAESLPLFETSTLFILLHAYEKYTGDTSLSQQYASLLTGYAEWLVDNSLYPSSQLISVDAIPASANQSALAVQSAIGLNAAGIITGNKTYSTIAASYANKIYNQGLGLDGDSPSTSTHFTYNYGSDSTWNVVFTAYADVLLGLNTFPAAAWAMQSSWYEQVIQPGGLPFAGPLSEFPAVNWGLTDWNLEAAAVSSAAVQAAVVNTTYTFLTNGLNSIPFGTKYVVEGSGIGTWLGDEARSTVGTHFALLALKQGFWYNPS